MTELIECNAFLFCLVARPLAVFDDDKDDDDRLSDQLTDWVSDSETESGIGHTYNNPHNYCIAKNL